MVIQRALHSNEEIITKIKKREIQTVIQNRYIERYYNNHTIAVHRASYKSRGYY